MSHTETLTGNDEVLDAAFRRAGVLRVDAIEDLFDMAEVLGKQPRPKGCRLAVITNAVEVRKDYALGLPPLNATLARLMMEQTRIYTALKGVRGRTTVDLAQLETLLVRFSLLVAQQRRIKEIEVNPLLVSPTKLLALDARIILHDPTVPEKDLLRLATDSIIRRSSLDRQCDRLFIDLRREFADHPLRGRNGWVRSCLVELPF
jgi:hypothetical protein